MVTDAGWFADPAGAHELRYWDGTDWTEDVSDAGNRSFDVVPPVAPPPEQSAAVPPDLGPGQAPDPGGDAAAPPAGIGPWQRRLSGAADRAAVRGRELADQVGATIDQQRARRRGR